MQISKRITLAVILSTLLLLTGCSALNDVVDAFNSFAEDYVEDDDTNDDEIDPSNKPTHLSDKNPHNLSSDFIIFINSIGAQMALEPELYEKEALLEQLDKFPEISEEPITKAELNTLIDDLFESFGKVPDDYPLPILPNATYYNYTFIGVEHLDDSDDSYDYWLGHLDFEQSIEEAMDFYRKALREIGFEITSEEIGDELPEGLGDATITSVGEINNQPYEIRFLFTEYNDRPNEVIIPIEYDGE